MPTGAIGIAPGIFHASAGREFPESGGLPHYRRLKSLEEARRPSGVAIPC
jgi:hypothetical protein